MRDDQGSAPPAPLVVAAGLVVVEGLLLLGYGVLEAAHIESARAAMGATTAAFFVLLAGLLIACGWLVVHGRAWPRSPIVVAQVMFLGLAWSFRGGDTTWVAIGPRRRRGRRPGRAAASRRASTRSPSPTRTTAVSSDRLLQRRPQLVEGAAEQPRDVHLADPDLRGDLRLGLVAEEAQEQDPLLARAGAPRAGA